MSPSPARAGTFRPRACASPPAAGPVVPHMEHRISGRGRRVASRCGRHQTGHLCTSRRPVTTPRNGRPGGRHRSAAKICLSTVYFCKTSSAKMVMTAGAAALRAFWTRGFMEQPPFPGRGFATSSLRHRPAGDCPEAHDDGAGTAASVHAAGSPPLCRGAARRPVEGRLTVVPGRERGEHHLSTGATRGRRDEHGQATASCRSAGSRQRRVADAPCGPAASAW
jgi:hypothetical protein